MDFLTALFGGWVDPPPPLNKDSTPGDLHDKDSTLENEPMPRLHGYPHPIKKAEVEAETDRHSDPDTSESTADPSECGTERMTHVEDANDVQHLRGASQSLKPFTRTKAHRARSTTSTGASMLAALEGLHLRSDVQDIDSVIDGRMDRLVKEGTRVHKSFKGNRTRSIQPTASMMQALAARAKADAQIHAEATAVQAQILAAGRVADAMPAEKRGQKRMMRMSLGLDASLGLEALTEVFGTEGTADDLFRPENNAAGHIVPGERELVAKVMTRVETERVEKLLRRHSGTPKPKPTVPKSPKLGVAARTTIGGRRSTPHAIPSYRSITFEFLALAPSWRQHTKQNRRAPGLATV